MKKSKGTRWMLEDGLQGSGAKAARNSNPAWRHLLG
jgi:hypothetical protein